MRQTNRHRTWAKAAITVAALLLASCSMMKEDRSDCPDCRNPLHIKVRYDYNIQRANMFADHVEQATVYVVDPATGSVVDWQSANVRSIAPQAEAASPRLSGSTPRLSSTLRDWLLAAIVSLPQVAQQQMRPIKPQSLILHSL